MRWNNSGLYWGGANVFQILIGLSGRTIFLGPCNRKPNSNMLKKKKNDNLLAYLIEIFKIMVPKVWFNRGLVSNANSEASPQIY